ncbi:MAG: hypothetical protein HYX92_21650 [Chloroflexi bacterium]|nr:hypothetical protein [Chloroflexota bacterium]
MPSEKFLIVASCFTVLGFLSASCASAASRPATTTTAPTPATKPAPPTAATAKPAGPAPTAKPAAEQPRYGGILTVGLSVDPESLDIHQEAGGSTFPITAATYNGLVKYDPHAWPAVKVVPDLATSWQVSRDGKAYTFNLVKGAKWHDGAPVTAEDAKFTFDRIRDPQAGLAKSPRRQQLANVASIDALDDYTVRVALKNPQASFLPLIATVFYIAVMPKRVVLEKKNDMRNTVVGSGPFKFKDRASGVVWELVKNPNYFVQGRPYLDGVKGYMIPDSFTRFAALRTRNILWWAPFPYMTVSQAKVIEEQLSDKIALQWAFHPAWYGAIFNVTRSPWSDFRVRQAVSLSFDRKKMLATGLQGAGVMGMAAQPPGEWSLPEEELMKAPGYAKPDVEGAKKLMAEAGFPDGFKAEALVRGVPAHQDAAVLVKDAVAAIGINLDLKVAETAVFNDARFRKAFGVIGGGAGTALMDPDINLGDFYLGTSANNWTGYSNPSYDELFTKQSQTLDIAERRKIVWEMQKILLRDVPIALSYWSNVPYAWWKEVRGFTPPVSYYNSFGYQDMWLAK